MYLDRYSPLRLDYIFYILVFTDAFMIDLCTSTLGDHSFLSYTVLAILIRTARGFLIGICGGRPLWQTTTIWHQNSLMAKCIIPPLLFCQNLGQVGPVGQEKTSKNEFSCIDSLGKII